MASIKIGGTDIEVPELNLKALKKIYPIAKKMRVIGGSISDLGPDEAMEALTETVEIISICLERSSQPMTADQIEDALLVSELSGLEPALIDILQHSGLTIKAPGEQSPVEDAAAPEAAEPESHSAGTSTPLSAKSSQDAEVQTGT